MSDFKTKKLKRPASVADEVYDTLRSAILSGRLKSNERLVEAKLAEEFGISRTPVREAIHKLELEGLVTPLSTGGVLVSPMSPTEIEEIFHVRQATEGYAGWLAASRIDGSGIAELEKIHQKTLQLLAESRPEEITKWNMKFHDIIYNASGSTKLVSLIRDFREYVFKRQASKLYTLRDFKRAIDEHAMIIEALRAGDADRTEKLIREQISNAKNVVLKERG